MGHGISYTLSRTDFCVASGTRRLTGLLVLALLCLLTFPMATLAAPRTALVIGNGSYKAAPLKNPTHDARDIAASLRKLGFDVIHKENVNRKQLRQAIRAFGNKLKSGRVGLFYYAGHGMQVKGKNYLIPVGADIQSEDEVVDEGVEAASVLRKMEAAGNGLNIAILDACRNNPFARSFRSSSRGLARMDAPSGTIVAYATAPGNVAADGVGRNGIYTKHLLAAMQQPGLSIEHLFKRVRINVERETHGKQTPWEESSLKGDFYFIPGKAGSGGSQSAPQPQPIVLAGGPDIAGWLKECDAHFKANRITSGAGGNALDCYRDVLAQDKGNSRALKGLAKIEKRYLDWTQAAIKKQNKAKAESNLKKLKQVNPEHADIDSLTSQIAKLSRPAPVVQVPQQAPSSTTQTTSVIPCEKVKVYVAWKKGQQFTWGKVNVAVNGVTAGQLRRIGQYLYFYAYPGKLVIDTYQKNSFRGEAVLSVEAGNGDYYLALVFFDGRWNTVTDDNLGYTLPGYKKSKYFDPITVGQCSY